MSLNHYIDEDICPCRIIPNEIYLRGSKVNGEKIFGKLVKLKIFYKNCVKEITFTINAKDKIQAVMQDHAIGRMKYLLPMK